MSVWQSEKHCGEYELGPDFDTESNCASKTQPRKSQVVRRIIATVAVLVSVAALAWLGGQDGNGEMLDLPKGSELTEVTALFEEDKGIANVKFEHKGTRHHYQLTPVSIYAKGGQFVEVDAREEVREPGPIRTFHLREDGRWANARLHEDGTVSGLFEHAGRVLRLRPLRSSALHSATHAVHSLTKGYFNALLSGHSPEGNVSAIAQRRLAELAVDTINETEFDWGHDHDWPHDEVPQIGAAIRDQGKWRGTKWYPGCYRGDRKLHSMELGIIGDVKAYQIHGARLEPFLQQVVHEASFIYEMQMNIRLVIGKLTIYKQAATAPNYAKDCTSSNARGDKGFRLLNYKLSTLTRAQVPFMASTHLFTSCIIAHLTGSWSMTVGLAWIGTICGGGSRAGVNMLNGDDTFPLFAHELGHNFNAQHSFEKGQGRTGGVMDYGDGKLNGVYQFNTRYRKKEICSTLNKRVGKCNDKFAVTNGGDDSDDNDESDGETTRPPSQGSCKTFPSGKPCVFPFKWNGETFNTCTSHAHNTLWCATSRYSDGNVKDWGTCRCCNYKTMAGEKCVFPTKYKKVKAQSCINVDHTRLWCNTRSGWGNCDTTCS